MSQPQGCEQRRAGPSPLPGQHGRTSPEGMRVRDFTPPHPHCSTQKKSSTPLPSSTVELALAEEAWLLGHGRAGPAPDLGKAGELARVEWMWEIWWADRLSSEPGQDFEMVHPIIYLICELLECETGPVQQN